jgi:glycosyltransferase involved in cell wall biosynthesis
MNGSDDITRGGSPGRCVIFFFEGYIGVQPTVANLARAMGRAGYDVTIYVPQTTWAPTPGALGEGVRIAYLRPRPTLARIGELGFGRFRLKKVAARVVPHATAFALRGLLLEARDRARGRRRTVYVGIDPDGASAALLSAQLLGRSFVFLSLELKTMSRLRRGLRGRVARLAYKRAAAVVVQGTDRLAVLTRELRTTHRNVFILPNSPFAAEDLGRTRQTFDLRSTLKIGPTKRVALQAGMINEVTCAEELARGFARQSDWALVLHERQKRAPSDPYLARLRELNSRNLYLSLDPVPYDEIDGVFAAADIGLAFYQSKDPADENFRLVSSSGKLPHYLKHRKPVLVSNLPSLVEVVEAYDCGLAIKDPSDADEIGAALERVLSRYEEMSRNAARCFTERYDFGRNAAVLTRFMNAL